jgi:hypothetical protein
MVDDFEDRKQELQQAVLDDVDEAPMEAAASEGTDAGENTEGSEDTRATGVTSHVLTCRGTIATSKSTFRAPTSGFLFMRVGYFDARGARIWLSPWVNKGSIAGLATKTHVESWNFSPRTVKRAVVVARFPTFDNTAGSKWADC